MNTDDAKRIAPKLGRIMAMPCVRNKQLETLHSGLTPVIRTGDYSDVFVVDADGRHIPWTEDSRIDDAKMRELMQEIVNRLYTFHLKADDPKLQAQIERWMGAASRWDDPEIDRRMISGNLEEALNDHNPTRRDETEQQPHQFQAGMDAGWHRSVSRRKSSICRRDDPVTSNVATHRVTAEFFAPIA